MPVPSPVRLRALQAAIVELVESFAPSGASVLWGWQQQHRDASAAVRVEIRTLSGPTALGSGGRGVIYLGPASATITVTAATPGVRTGVEINGLDAFEDAVLGDTTTTLRNRLRTRLDALVANDDLDVVLANSGAAGIVITPEVAGGLYSLRLVGELSAALGSEAPYKLKQIDHAVSLEIQAYVRRTSTQPLSPRNGAEDVCARIGMGLERDDTGERLARDGFGLLSRSAPVNLDALSGAEIESRAALDLTMLAPGVVWEPVQTVGSVVGSIAFSPPPNVLTLATILAP